MRRRDFIKVLAGSAAAWPLAERAQPADRIARVGFFGADRSVPLGATLYQAFIDELQIHGFKNGQNLIVDFRRVEQDLRALSADAAALVRSNVNVLVTQGTEPALHAAVGATRTLPIVMMAANYDPFASGYVKSLARPDGNVTGVFLRQTELAEKQTELLWQAFPDRTRIGILWDAISADQFSAAERRAKIFGLQVHPYDFEAAFGSLAAASTQTLLVPVEPAFHARARPDRATGDSAPDAHDVHLQDLRGGGRTPVVRRRFPRHASAGRHARRSREPGSETF
jgi:ABC transporter substrate binding protein